MSSKVIGLGYDLQVFKFLVFGWKGRCVFIVGIKVMLPYLAFFVGVCCKTGVWVALSVCLLLFVGACCLVSVVWRCPGGTYVAGCIPAGCRSEIGVRIYISLRVFSLMFLR
jgi:hypothetical protein